MLFLILWMPNPLVDYLSLLIISAESEVSHSQPRLKNASVSSMEPEQKKKKKSSKFMVEYTFAYCIETKDSSLVKVM